MYVTDRSLPNIHGPDFSESYSIRVSEKKSPSWVLPLAPITMEKPSTVNDMHVNDCHAGPWLRMYYGCTRIFLAPQTMDGCGATWWMERHNMAVSLYYWIS